MRKRFFMSLAVSALLIGTSASALSLKESMLETLETNPVVQERLKNFNETQRDLDIVKSEWLPSVDLRSSMGRVNSGDIKDKNNKNWSHTAPDSSYSHYTNSLKVTQNIFKGFSTTEKINYQEARILAAAHHYVENVNDIAFQLSGAYIDVIRTHRLMQNARDNVSINEQIYKDVKSLYEQGLTTKSEMTKINAALALSKSNLVVAQNNAVDKASRLKRLLGRDVDVATLELPPLDLAMPESKQRASQIAITNNPSMLVSHYNIKGAEALYQEKKSKFYPTVDLEFEQMFNDYSRSHGVDPSLDGAEDRQRAYVVLNWNIYSGGAHLADVQKSKSTIYKEVETHRDLKRQTIEGLELSWHAYELLSNQLADLYSYYEYSKETLESYQSEYEMGRRTLLDLLTAQNDLISSNAQIINAQMDKLFAQYRILDAMGMLVQTIADPNEYESIIAPTLNPFESRYDNLPVRHDVDDDGIVDSLDLCDNSVLGRDDITPYGCNQATQDSDFDGVPDAIDECPNTPFGAKVDAKGCEAEGSSNRYNAQDSLYIDAVTTHTDQSPIKDAKASIYDYEFSAAAGKNIHTTGLDKHLYYDEFELIRRYPFVSMNKLDANELDKIASDIKANAKDGAVVTIIGNTRGGESKQVASRYAKDVRQALVDRGVDEKILKDASRADLDRYFLETNSGDEKLNDVVAVALYNPMPKVEPKAVVVQEAREPEVEDGDDDNDGVPNSLDKCPDTPTGYAVDSDGCTRAIDLEVLFGNNSAEVVESSASKTLAFAKFMQDNQEFDAIITGHASKDGSASAEYNKRLSLQRADAIKLLLIENGVSSSRLSAVGKGYDEPIASNDTPEGQAQNRRIEATLIRR
ncbi:MAG: TolC family protein [Sulfuricurvum sp.]